MITPILARNRDGFSENNSSLSNKAGESNLFCFPNPAGDNVSIIFEARSEEDRGTLTLFDSHGRVMISLNKTLQKGVNALTLNTEIHSLPEGVYNVQLVSKDTIKNGRFIKR
ncbi:MAG TPA: hypothetical protein DCF33_12290 [Saprospirales bacterium]|nr:hypothetical protein [Saprospirales bacterium]